uniref:PTB-containing, cubilin and LRP1-interacting protein n=1 Tax=Myxine glutinosa TaxID=7769 RepID=UPI00358EE70C
MTLTNECLKVPSTMMMLKSRLEALILRQEQSMPGSPPNGEAIELSPTTISPHRKGMSGCKVSYLGKERLPILTTFTPGCTSTAVDALCTRGITTPSYLNLRPFILRLRPVATEPTTNVVKSDTSIQQPALTFEVSRIAFCSAEHLEHPEILAWVYRETGPGVDPQLWCHAVECECPIAARRLAHTMMKAFQCTLRGLKSKERLPSVMLMAGQESKRVEEGPVSDKAIPEVGASLPL